MQTSELEDKSISLSNYSCQFNEEEWRDEKTHLEKDANVGIAKYGVCNHSIEREIEATK